MRRRRGYRFPSGPSTEHIEYKYQSLAELVNMAVNGKSGVSTDYRSSRRDAGDKWAGTTWEEAADKAVNGDMAGAKKLSPAILQEVNAMVKNLPRLDPVYRLDEGQSIDVARYVRGEPECWLDMVESAPVQRRGAAVIINCAVSSMITSAAIERVGVSIGSAILGLQAQGYNVTLYSCEYITGNSGKTLSITAPVNPGGTPLDVSRLSIILRPWYLRRIIFSLNETYTREVREEFGFGGGNYGSPRTLGADVARKLTGLDNTVIVNFNTAVANPDRVAADIADQIIKGA